MIDFNSKSMFSDRINWFIDEPLKHEANNSPKRSYIGASIIGHPCDRHVQYHLLETRKTCPKKAFSPRTIRIFDRGNIYEEKARIWLKNAGFLFGYGKHGKSFHDFDNLFQGHVDGIITGWKKHDVQCPIPLPVLWENKCLNSKNWKKVSTDKLKDYSSIYYAQVQMYMYYTGLANCLFTAVNADTMELYHELVPYNKTEANLILARVESIINATNNNIVMQKCASKSDFYICKLCDFRKECWHENTN